MGIESRNLAEYELNKSKEFRLRQASDITLFLMAEQINARRFEGLPIDKLERELSIEFSRMMTATNKYLNR